MAPSTKQTLLIAAFVIRLPHIDKRIFGFVAKPFNRILLHIAELGQLAIRVSCASQKCLIVIGLLMRRASCLVFHSLTLCDVDQMTAQTRSTEVGPIRFSNLSHNCRVVASTKDDCRPRAHTTRFYVFRCLYGRQKTKIA